MSFSMSMMMKPFVATPTPIDSWANKLAMTTGRRNLSAAVVSDKIYCIWWNSWITYYTTNQEYNPATNTWITKAAMTTSRYWLSCVAYNWKIYCLWWDRPPTWTWLNLNEAYDVASNTWSTLAWMPWNSFYWTVAEANWKIYYFSWFSSWFWTTAIYEYDITLNSWTTKTSTTPVYSCTAITYNNKIYCLWWSSLVDWSISNSNFVYDPILDSITTLEPLPFANRQFWIWLLNWKIYTIWWSSSNKTMEYNIALDSWDTSRTDIPTPNYSSWYWLINSKMYMIWWVNNLTINQEYSI